MQKIYAVSIKYFDVYTINFSLAFNGVRSTRFLNLSHNVLVYTKSDSNHSFFNLFKYLDSLEELDLSHNRLNLTGVDMSDSTEAVLPCLRIINLSDNPISSIEENFLLPLRESNLQELNLQNCQLEYIHPCEI